MIHAVNIITDTREGDAYPRVAVNLYPIIYIDDESAEGILDDPEFIEIIRKYVKNKKVYQNANINIKSVTDDFESATCVTFKLSDKIKIEEWA